MPETNPFLIFTRRFESIGVHYMVTGSVAATVYGEPRLTNDVDIVAAVAAAHVLSLSRAFPLAEFYLPPAEVIRVEMARTHRGHFNIIHHETGLKADIYLAGRDALHDWGLAHARPITVDGRVVNVAPPEYVIVRKLEFFREGGSEKHLNDVRGMLANPLANIDTQTIATFAAQRGLSEFWDRAKAVRGPA